MYTGSDGNKRYLSIFWCYGDTYRSINGLNTMPLAGQGKAAFKKQKYDLQHTHTDKSNARNVHRI